MNNYCKTIDTLDTTAITHITIPPSCGERTFLFVVQTVMKNGGKIWENPALGSDGSLQLTRVTFQSDDGRKKCCEEIEKAIEKELEKQRPISIKPVEGKEDQFEFRLNIKYLFVEFQKIMKEIYPVLEFVENNGGWFNPETRQFPGFDALEKLRDEKETKEIEAAFIAFGNFMGAYMLGAGFIGDDKFAIVPHEF